MNTTQNVESYLAYLMFTYWDHHELQLDLPIIAVTARVELEAEHKALEAGVTRVIHKPFQMNTLQQLLDDFLPTL